MLDNSEWVFVATPYSMINNREENIANMSENNAHLHILYTFVYIFDDTAIHTNLCVLFIKYLNVL